jgi:molybdopterin molybdotransferase
MKPKGKLIAFKEALERTQESIEPLAPRTLTLTECNGHVLAQDMRAKVASPAADNSMKDGFAVVSQDISGASPDNPVPLEIVGSIAAGGSTDLVVSSGKAMRLFTGARIPMGADAVLAEEFTQLPKRSGHQVESILAIGDADSGRNILPAGSDVALGESILPKGTPLTPGRIGLAAAAGHGALPVTPSPRVFILATGDEVIMPGRPLGPGQLYASNLMTLAAWCRRFGWETSVAIVGDREAQIREAVQGALACHDAILTSGGAWNSDRDLMTRCLAQLGWRKIYHRVRLGPGKGVGLGLLQGVPIFILPGGPPSNLVAFLQLALPGLQRLAGSEQLGLPRLKARLGAEVTGQSSWTQVLFAHLEEQKGLPVVHPIRARSRLKSMARARALITIGEGVAKIAAGELLEIQMLG